MIVPHFYFGLPIVLFVLYLPYLSLFVPLFFDYVFRGGILPMSI